jgi:hypothetical protein
MSYCDFVFIRFVCKIGVLRADVFEHASITSLNSRSGPGALAAVTELTQPANITFLWICGWFTLSLCAFPRLRFYSSVLRIINIYPWPNFKSCCMHEPYLDLLRNVMQMVILALENYGTSLISKLRLLHFWRFRYKRQDSPVFDQVHSASATQGPLRIYRCELGRYTVTVMVTGRRVCVRVSVCVLHIWQLGSVWNSEWQ